jgi:hypothetical protein
MKPATVTLALAFAAALPLRAEVAAATASATHVSGSGQAHVAVSTGSFAFDLIFNSLAFGLEVAALDAALPEPVVVREPYAQRGYGEPWDAPSRRRMQAREGLLLSFGLGGGSAYLSSQGPGRVGAFDLDFRLGYGFSDRFQLFMDFGADAGNYPDQSADFTSWTFTIRGQTVLIGDRAGNGLNVNFGAGVGGVDYNAGYFTSSSSSTGLALAGGLSYDARLTPAFSLSPEFFVNWHQIPNRSGLADDVSSVYGVRLNFLWYLK